MVDCRVAVVEEQSLQVVLAPPLPDEVVPQNWTSC